MGYYASGGGTIYFRNPLSEEKKNEVSAILENAWHYGEWYKDNRVVDVQMEYDKYNYDTEEAINEIAKNFAVESGSIEYTGEDCERWRFVYNPKTGRFDEENARFYYDCDLGVPNDDRCEFIGQVIDLFEDFLEARRIDIPNDDKEQSENPAIIYGMDYDELSSGIGEIMFRWGVFR